MPTAILPLWQLLGLVRRDTIRALQAMPGAALSLFGIMLAGDALDRMLTGWATGWQIVWLVKLVVWFLAIHYLIMVHRFILLGEVAPRFRLEPRDRLTWQFFGMWLVLALLPVVPSTFLGVLVLTGFGRSTAAPAVAILSCLLLLGLTFRMSVLLPAIAVGASGATWAAAYADTRGNAWRIIGAFVTAAFAFGAVWLVLAWVLPSASASGGARPAAPAVILTRLVFNALAVFASTYFVALASRLFEQVADRMAQPLPPASIGSD